MHRRSGFSPVSRRSASPFKKTSEKGNAYLSVLIDDPSFAKPIWANLLTSSKSDELPLMWDRPKPKKEA